MLAALVVNLMAVLPLFLSGAMAVQIARDLQVGPATVAILSSLFAVATMFGSAPLGSRVGHWGVRRSLRISSLISATALLLAAVSPSIPMLGFALLVGGTANALGQPAGNALVAAQVSPNRFGLGFAIKQSGIPLATLLGGLAVPWVALPLGWRTAYLLAAAGVVVAVLLVPADMARYPGRSESAVPRPLRKPLWMLALSVSAAVVAATSIGALGAAGGVEVGLAEGTAGYLVAVGGMAGLAVRLGSGTLADRLPFDSLHAMAALCVLGALGWLAMATGSVGAYAVGLVVANAFGWGWPGLQHLAVARRFPTATAAASGVTQTGVAIGLLVGPAALGVVAASFGWSWVWSLAACAALAGATGVWFAAARIPVPEIADIIASRRLRR